MYVQVQLTEKTTNVPPPTFCTLYKVHTIQCSSCNSPLPPPATAAHFYRAEMMKKGKQHLPAAATWTLLALLRLPGRGAPRVLPWDLGHRCPAQRPAHGLAQSAGRQTAAKVLRKVQKAFLSKISISNRGS